MAVGKGVTVGVIVGIIVGVEDGPGVIVGGGGVACGSVQAVNTTMIPSKINKRVYFNPCL